MVVGVFQLFQVKLQSCFFLFIDLSKMYTELSSLGHGRFLHLHLGSFLFSQSWSMPGIASSSWCSLSGGLLRLGHAMSFSLMFCVGRRCLPVTGHWRSRILEVWGLFRWFRCCSACRKCHPSLLMLPFQFLRSNLLVQSGCPFLAFHPEFLAADYKMFRLCYRHSLLLGHTLARWWCWKGLPRVKERWID